MSKLHDVWAWFNDCRGTLRFRVGAGQARVSAEPDAETGTRITVVFVGEPAVPDTWRALATMARAMETAALRHLPYDEYLKTEHWQERRRAALEAARYVCQFCYKRDVELHAHHLTYERLGEELPTDLRVLCSLCHQAAHGGPVASLDHDVRGTIFRAHLAAMSGGEHRAGDGGGRRPAGEGDGR